ncbi:MAG TPA: 6-phosphofructokinase [Bacteroidia bacterium]|nr:6-phosphofructokinase [Bacteroidia bacterium]
MTTIKKIAILTSGGDAPGLNACIRAVVRAAVFHDIKVMGIHRGYEGMMDGDLFIMNASTVSNIIQRGGTILKSSRSERFKTQEGRALAYHQLRKENIDGVILIGGDGSFAGSRAFISTYNIPFIGIPKTIDNDINGTDYSIGFDTATNTAMEAIDKIRDTAESHNRIFFVEVMGRDAGFIAYQTGISSGAEAIYIPETKTDLQHLFSMLETGWNRKKNSLIVVVAEGDEVGGAFKISRQVKNKFPQYDMKICILGHVQRGGSPSCADRVLASKLGVAAVDALLSGKINVMVGEIKNEIVYTPLEKVVKKHLQIAPSMFELINVLSS